MIQMRKESNQKEENKKKRENVLWLVCENDEENNT